jgi:hypothetical protein
MHCANSSAGSSPDADALGFSEDPQAAIARPHAMTASAIRAFEGAFRMDRKRLYAAPYNTSVTLLCRCYVQSGILGWRAPGGRNKPRPASPRSRKT